MYSTFHLGQITVWSNVHAGQAPSNKSGKTVRAGRAVNRRTPQLPRFTESVRVEHIAVNCRPTWWHAVPPLLDWRSFDDAVTVALYYCSPQKVVWQRVWDVSFRRPAVELLVLTTHSRAQPCHTKSARRRPIRWGMGWKFTGVSGRQMRTSSSVVQPLILILHEVMAISRLRINLKSL